MKEGRCGIENQARREDIPVTELEFSPRAYNALRLNGLRWLSQIGNMSLQELNELDYMTPAAAEEIYLCCRDLTEALPERQAGEEAAEEAAARGEADVRDAEPTPIEGLGLSVRSYNALKREGIHTLGQLLALKSAELAQIRNLGAKSLEELEALRSRYVPPASETVRRTEPIRDERPIERLGLSVRSFNALKREGIHTVGQLLALKSVELAQIRNLGAKSLEELERIRSCYVPPAGKTGASPEELKALVLGAFSEPFRGLAWQEIRDALPESAEDGAVRQAVGALLAEGKLEYVDFRCYRVYPSFYSFLDTYLETVEERNRELLRRRYAGETLEAIARDLSLTRERVRQIQNRQNNKLREAYQKQTGLTAFDEDYYEALYTKCELPDAFWREELELPERSINYLEYTFKKGGKRPEEILKDEEIPVSLRYRVRSFLDRDKLRIDGRLFPRNRAEIEAYALEKYAQDELSFGRFVELYNGMLEENGIPFNEKYYYTEGNIRTRANHFADSPFCLWKQGERLRWYDISSRDYSELLETLHLDSYQNTELSTRKLLTLYPALMEKYDLRDPYELHNLLKKIKERCGLDFVSFSRQPILQFGDFDRTGALKEAMFELAPVTQQELLDYLELEFGYDRQRAVGYLSSLAPYYHNGTYSVDFKRVPAERAEALQKALTEDFYYLNELRQQYIALFPGADPEEINPRSLKELGFIVNSGYAIRHYPSADAYFRQLLTRDEVYSAAAYLKRYGTVQMFNQAYAELLQSRQIFRFEKDQIITLRRLGRLQITRETIEDYCAAVQAFTEEESYFTVSSLRRDGFRHPLDELGFDEYFYGSLLWSDQRFSGQRVFGTIVLFNGKVNGMFSIADFLSTQLRSYDSVEPEDFMQDMEERFGIRIPNRYEVIYAIKSKELYYDSIMDKIYRDKALFYADLDE